MILDSRLEQWTQMQCEKHSSTVHLELTARFQQQLCEQQRLHEAQEEAAREQFLQQQHVQELTSELLHLNQMDTSVMNDTQVLRHVEQLSKVEADLQELQRDFLQAATVEVDDQPPPEPRQTEELDRLDPQVLALRRQWEELVHQDVQHMSNEEALRHVEAISQLQGQLEAAETQAALARSAATAQPGSFDEGSFAVNTTFERSRWPLPMALESPTAWPTARMLRREGLVRLARKRAALQTRQSFERKMADLTQAREMEIQRRRDLEILREQEELERQSAARQAEERRQRAQELDDLARRAVAQMVGGQREGSDRRARMCGRCRAGPIINEACSNLATHNNDSRRRANHCPRCSWFDRNWNNWPEWDGVYGPH